MMKQPNTKPITVADLQGINANHSAPLLARVQLTNGPCDIEIKEMAISPDGQVVLVLYPIRQ